MVNINVLRFFLSLNLSLPYNIESINLFSLSVEKELSISFSHFLGQTCLRYRNGNAENSVQWFWFDTTKTERI